MTSNNNLIQYKVVMLGAVGTGKSSILKQLLHDDFRKSYEATIGVDFGNKYHEIDGNQCKFSIWDTSGSKVYFNIVKSYFQNTDIALIIFDLTDTHSFTDCTYWFEQYRNINPNKPILIIGNKVDKTKDIKISDSDVSNFIKKTNEPNLKYIKVSAFTGENIDDILLEIYKCTPIEHKKAIDLNKTTSTNDKLCCTIL